MSGIGQRFIDAGYTVPKPLIIIENKPIIEHIVNLFPNETDIIFICNDIHLKTTNMSEILKRIAPKCTIYEVSASNRRGPVDAINQIATHIDDDNEIIVSYCDYGTQWNYNEFISEVHNRNADGAIACYKGFHPHMLNNDNYAFVQEQHMNLISIQEKKSFTSDKMSEYASNGTYYFKNGKIMKKYFKQLIDENICVNNEYYVSMVYNLLVADKLSVIVFEIKKMLQWGTPKDLEEYLVWSNYFTNRDANFNKNFTDKYNTTLILPMAGAGSRFAIDGFILPKPLILIEGVPMVIKAVECLPATSRKIFICQKSHINKYDVSKIISDVYADSHIIEIDYLTEGQAKTCEIGINDINIDPESPIVISACDNGIYYDIYKYEQMLADDSVDIIIWSFSDNPTSKLYPNMYAWIDVDDDNNIMEVSVKKPFTNRLNKYCIIGTMTFKKCKYFKEGLEDIYKDNIKTNNEYYVDNMINSLIKRGYRCKIFNVDNYLCWGTPNDYKTYQYWYEYFICK
jgi:NDP-sugar pyrophosphorylase family protein